MRLFVAIEAPEAWRRAAAAVQRALPSEVRDALRLVDPALMHVTLRFLGDVDAERVPDLEAALRRRVPPVEVALTLGAPATFGPPARMAVALLRVEGDLRGLRALAGRVDAAVKEALGVPPEEWPLNPHVTLGRLNRRATPGQRRAVAEAVAALSPPPEEPFVARRVVLVRSHMGPAGPRYEVLAGVA